MSIILGKYKNKRKLGKGAYGDVLLVEDPDGRQLALKMISKKVLSKDPFMQEYIEGEKACMMSVKSPYIMELYSVEEDDNYIYFVCEYCDGGDLLNYQAKQEKKVFPIKQATKILSEVILGLQLLHKMGYLHRDIKPQNILLKKTKDGINYMFKLADFGFAKRNEDVGGTVLGTQNYMSPEIYHNEIYSYQVDMWAFGVLLYFMLNMEFPFRLNPHASLEQKREELIKQAEKFSYAEAVKKSKKKIIENCTPQVEDLFKRMFNSDGQKRITFVEIREHPIFKDYFPNIDNQSRILYNKKKALNRYDSFVQGRLSAIQTKGNKNNVPSKSPAKQYEPPENIEPTYGFKRPKTTQQKQILEYEVEKVRFLYEAEEQLTVNLPFIDPAQLLAFRYNVLKYYVMLLRVLNGTMKAEYYEKKYPKYKWKDFFKTPEFNTIKRQIKDLLDQAQIKVSQTYDQCRNSLAALKKYNPTIDLVLEPEVTELNFDGKFKQSYRCSTMGIYGKVREKFSNGNRYVYLTLLIILCHFYNRIMEASGQQLEQIFIEFLKDKKSVDFGELKSWLSQSEKQKLKNIIKQLLQKYF